MTVKRARRRASCGAIAFFVPVLGRGGAERVVVNLANELCARGIRVHVVVSDLRRSSYTRALHGGVVVHDLLARGPVHSFWRLCCYLRRHRPAALLTVEPVPAIIAGVATRLVSPGTVFLPGVHNQLSEHSAHLPRRRRLLLNLSVAVVRRCRAIVAVSEGAADDLHRCYGISHRRIHVVYNPISVPPGITTERGALRHSIGGEHVVLGVGRLCAQKNFSLLIRAMAAVVRSVDARLLLLGDGPERGSLKALAGELGLGGVVRFAGFVDDPFPYMARASALVVSSNWEGLSNVLIEAMMLGCPVVSTDCPSGPAEILAGGSYGRLVVVGDVEGMAQAIVETLRSPLPEDVLRSRAATFRADVVADRYIALIEGLRACDGGSA